MLRKFVSQLEREEPDGNATAYKLFFVALEQSGDHLGAALIRALSQRTDRAIEVSGIGGALMGEMGVTSLFPIDDFSIIGFAAIPKRLLSIVSHMVATLRAIRTIRPAALILIDSPTYNLPLARFVRWMDASISIVFYVSPPIWAWRFNRARSMNSRIDRVLALFPFEPAEYVKRGGPVCRYVGHPLIDGEASSLQPNEAELSLRASEPARIVLMPGSRAAEISRLLPLFGTTVQKIAGKHDVALFLPTFPHLVPLVEQLTSSWTIRPQILLDPQDKLAALRGARAALTKSGTNTLEFALAGVPMVVAYKVSALEAFVFRILVKSRTFALPNLIVGKKFVPEIIHDNCTPDVLADALRPLLFDDAARRKQLDGFDRLRQTMGVGTFDPSAKAAEEVLAVLDELMG